MSSPASSPRGIYRPRHPERTSVYQLFDRHFDRYALEYEERFEPRHGPLRSVVRRVVEEYLECGRPEGGFARLRCPSCCGEHLLAFSCQTRNFCPSCQAKRAALFAEHLVETVLSDVPHRHVVFTVPKVVRGLFERERRLLSILPRCAHEAVQRVLREAVDDRRAQVGAVASIPTFGSYAANFHPHVHALVTEGAFHVDASGKAVEFARVPWWDRDALSEMLRGLGGGAEFTIHYPPVAVFCHDPDAPLITPSGKHGYVHGVLYGIPGDVHALPEGTKSYTAGRNETGELGYTGPMPPKGHGTHHYFFWVVALDAIVDLPAGLTLWEMLEEIEPHWWGRNGGGRGRRPRRGLAGSERSEGLDDMGLTSVVSLVWRPSAPRGSRRRPRSFSLIAKGHRDVAPPPRSVPSRVPLLRRSVRPQRHRTTLDGSVPPP